MKIRDGFVSNSSSTSFVVLGVRMRDDKAPSWEAAQKAGLIRVFDSDIDEPHTYVGVGYTYDGSGVEQLKPFPTPAEVVKAIGAAGAVVKEKDVHLYAGTVGS